MPASELRYAAKVDLKKPADQQPQLHVRDHVHRIDTVLHLAEQMAPGRSVRREDLQRRNSQD